MPHRSRWITLSVWLLVFDAHAASPPSTPEPPLSTATFARADGSQRAALQAIYGRAPGAKAGAMAKLGLGLALLYQRQQLGAATGGAQGVPSALTRAVSPDGSLVLIDALAKPGEGAVLFQAMVALGLRDAERFSNVVSGRVPIAQLAALARLAPLAGARPAYMATSIGSVTSQGDEALEADDARMIFGVDGSGVTVGVLSDSFDNFDGTPLTDYAADVASGDLPAGVTLLDDSVTGTDEGRAMAQLISDLAPGAQLSFHTAFGGLAGFAQGLSIWPTLART